MSELLEELYSRTQSCIVAYTMTADGGQGRYDIRRNGCNLTLLGLARAVALNADGAFQQKMHKDEIL